MTSLLSRPLVLFTLFLTAAGLPAQQPGTSPVKIYILAGQSNMVGQGNMSPATTPGTTACLSESRQWSEPADGSDSYNHRQYPGVNVRTDSAVESAS